MAQFLRTLLCANIIKHINDIIILQTKIGVLKNASDRLCNPILSSRGAVRIIDGVISYILDLTHLDEYVKLKKTVDDWVRADALENEYNDGPYAKYRAQDYEKLLLFTGGSHPWDDP